MTTRSPKNTPGVRKAKDVTPAELARVREATSWLVSAYREDPEEAAEYGVTPGQVQQLEHIEEEIGRTIKLPRMKAVALAALRGGITGEQAKTGFYLAIRAFHAMAPYILMKAAEKMDDHQAPGSTRVILELLKGSGIFQPAEPISAKKRLDQLDEEFLSRQSEESLRDEILGYS